jgi:hypothetical protein
MPTPAKCTRYSSRPRFRRRAATLLTSQQLLLQPNGARAAVAANIACRTKRWSKPAARSCERVVHVPSPPATISALPVVGAFSFGVCGVFAVPFLDGPNPLGLGIGRSEARHPEENGRHFADRRHHFIQKLSATPSAACIAYYSSSRVPSPPPLPPPSRAPSAMPPPPPQHAPHSPSVPFHIQPRSSVTPRNGPASVASRQPLVHQSALEPFESLSRRR